MLVNNGTINIKFEANGAALLSTIRVYIWIFINEWFHWQFLITYRGSVERVQSKKRYLMFTYVFLAILLLFFIKKLCFYHFHDFFWRSIKFPQQNINHSQTGIDNKKLSVEMHAIALPNFLLPFSAYLSHFKTEHLLLSLRKVPIAHIFLLFSSMRSFT